MNLNGLAIAGLLSIFTASPVLAQFQPPPPAAPSGPFTPPGQPATGPFPIRGYDRLDYTLDASMPPYGALLPFGSGNTNTDFYTVVNQSKGTAMGIQAHYRTGDYVSPVTFANTTAVATLDANHNNPAGFGPPGSANYGIEPFVRIAMDSGYQIGGQHNMQGTRTDRSAASFDIAFNNVGNGAFMPGNTTSFSIYIDRDPSAAFDWLKLDLVRTGAGTAVLKDALGNTVMTDDDGTAFPNAWANSINFGFGFLGMPHGPAGTGDIPDGRYDVILVETVGGVVVSNLHVAFDLG